MESVAYVGMDVDKKKIAMAAYRNKVTNAATGVCANTWSAESPGGGLEGDNRTLSTGRRVLEYKLQTMVPEFADLNEVLLPRPIKFSLHAEKSTVAFA